MTVVTTGQVRAGRREWVALAVLVLPLLLVSMDVSVLYFAVPFIARDLALSATEQLWIFDVYGFVLAGFLLTMGALGDRIGRRRLLLCGAVGFSLASLGAAYAPSAGGLIAARAVLGVAGATLMPSTLALIRSMFDHEDDRRKAIGVWSAAMMSGIALGPVISGVLLEHFWWGSVFLINIPAMALLLALGPVLLPEYRGGGRGRFDWISSLLSMAAVLPAIYGIKEWAADGPSPLRAGCVAVGAAMAAVFVLRQRRGRDTVLDATLFAKRAFRVSVGLNGVVMFAMIGNAVFLTQYLQTVLGMSPLRAALWSLVPSVVVGAAAPTAAAIAPRVGTRAVLVGGLLLAAAGFGVITQVHAHSPLIVCMVGAGALSSGLVAVISLITDIAVGAVATENAGAASAVMETSNEFGGALGIAILGSVGVAVYRDRVAAALTGLPPGAAKAAHETLGGAVGVAAGLPAASGKTLADAARAAFTAGMNAEAAVGAALLVGMALVVARVMRSHEGRAND